MKMETKNTVDVWPKYPLTAVWDLTYECNLRCKHCYIEAGAKKPGELSSSQALALVGELADCGAMYLDLGGGEPLLRNDLEEIIRAATRSGIECAISTNAWFLTESKAKSLKKAGLKKCFVSLDGADAETHSALRNTPESFERAVAGIKNALNADIECSTITTVTKANTETLDEIACLVSSIGCKEMVFGKFICLGRGHENELALLPTIEESNAALEKLSEFKKYATAANGLKIRTDCSFDAAGAAYNCFAGTLVCGIRPNGDVTPCAFFPLVVGNVKKESFAKIWSESAAIAALKAAHKEKTDGCAGCAKTGCKGGCKGRTFAAYGDFMKKDPACSGPKSLGESV